ncbi:hypothetical protein Q5752_001964 [Cryptotrichosporon argae]
MFSPRSVALLPFLGVALAEYTFTISPSNYPSLCLAPSGTSNGSAVVVTTCDSSSVTWTYTSAGQLQNTASSLCIDVTNDGQWNGNKAQVWTCFSDNGNQRFAFENSTQILWDGLDFCLDLTNGVGEAGTDIQIWQCTDGNANQQWTVTEASSTSPFSTSAKAAVSTSSRASSSTSAPSSTSSAGAVAIAEPSSTSTSATSTASLSLATSSSTSGYLQTSGTTFVTPSGDEVILRGINVGGWFEREDWMSGLTDSKDTAGRFSLQALESRFGVTEADTLEQLWQENFIVADDFAEMAALGFNHIRLPFSWRNLQWENGTWRDDPWTRLDWAVEQAAASDLYVVLTFHIWEGQQANYSLISENTDEGAAERALAAVIWANVTQHYYGESAIAGFDIMNEPTGSWGNQLQIELYDAVRAVDADRIIFIESCDTCNPSTYGWTQVVYEIHEYNMKSSNYTSNLEQWNAGAGPAAYFEAFSSKFNCPSYLGEFEASSITLDYIFDQLNNASHAWGAVSWAPWTWKAVDAGGWAVYNYPANPINVETDTYETIFNAWSDLGTAVQDTTLYNTLKTAATGSDSLSLTKRDIGEVRPVGAHKGRSRRGLGRHALRPAF